MINLEFVAQALDFISLYPKEEAERAYPYCLLAVEEFTRRLKDEAYGNLSEVVVACAATALYRYTLSRSITDEEFSSFKAGDVTITRSRSADRENAAKLRDEALCAAAPYLTDVDFVFGTVDV